MSKLFRNIILVSSHHSPLVFWILWKRIHLNGQWSRTFLLDWIVWKILYVSKSYRSVATGMDDQLQSSSLCFINTRQLGNESYVVISLNCRMDWGYIRAIVYIFCFWFICLLVFVFMEYFKLFTRNNKVSRLLVNLNRLSMMYFMFPCDQFSILLMGRRCTLSV